MPRREQRPRLRHDDLEGVVAACGPVRLVRVGPELEIDAIEARCQRPVDAGPKEEVPGRPGRRIGIHPPKDCVCSSTIEHVHVERCWDALDVQHENRDLAPVGQRGQCLTEEGTVGASSQMQTGPCLLGSVEQRGDLVERRQHLVPTRRRVNLDRATGEFSVGPVQLLAQFGERGTGQEGVCTVQAGEIDDRALVVQRRVHGQLGVSAGRPKHRLAGGHVGTMHGMRAVADGGSDQQPGQVGLHRCGQGAGDGAQPVA